MSNIKPVDDYTKSIAEETGLHGKWEDIVINCPTCNSSDNVYLYVDQRTCYCLECTYEFDIRDAFPELDDFTFNQEDITPSVSFDTDEDKAIQQQLAAQLVSDDPQEVNEAIRLLELAKPDAKKYVQGQKIADNQTKNYKQTGFQGGYTGGYSGNYGYEYKANTCYHRPQHIIAGEGWGVWAGKKEDVRDSLTNYDIVMNLTYTSVKDVHVIPIPELAKWSDYGSKFIEIQMDWADYGTINLPVQFWQDLVNHIRDNKLKLLIFCQGGHGRTGTALACLFVVALGYKPIDAINWVRKNYCNEAIETKGQENYVLSMAPMEQEIIEVKAEPDSNQKSLALEKGN